MIAEIFDKCKQLRNHIAVVDPETNRELTFWNVLENAVKLSDSLPLVEDEIALFLVENNINYYYVMLACLFKGVIFQSADPNGSKYELNHIISISKPKAIFSSNRSLEKAIDSRDEFHFIKHIINVETLDKNVKADGILIVDELIENSKMDINNFKIPVFDHSKIVTIFNSSGTTGLSKGVIVNYKNLNFSLTYIRNPDFYQIGPKDVTISLCPFYHLFGFLITIYGLVTGMKAVTMVKFNIRRYMELIQDYGATTLFLVPPVATLLAKHPCVENYKTNTLKDIICGAAPMGIEIQGILKKRLNVRVRQIYGMTETTNFLTSVPINPAPGKSGSVGLVLPGCTIEIRHIKTNEILTNGQIGQLYAKGPLITQGYWKNELETNNAIDQNGFLCSGDIGYRDNDGYIYIVDRLKEMIKYKGFQVPPAELEDLIKSHPLVQDAAVIGKPDEYAGELSTAFVVKQSETLKEQDIIEFVADNMKYQKQLHGGVIFIDIIPKTPSGKILRRKLREVLTHIVAIN